MTAGLINLGKKELLKYKRTTIKKKTHSHYFTNFHIFPSKKQLTSRINRILVIYRLY